MELLVRYDGARALLSPLFDRYARIEVGAPGPCPACGEFGFIDLLDVRRDLQSQHCRSCGYRWEYQFRGDGRLLEVRGSGPLPVDDNPAVPDTVLDLRDPDATYRVVPRRRQRPLRAEGRRQDP